MDEAERCHRLAYISYGELLTSGTAEEVVARQNLSTWSVSGPDLPALEKQLLGVPGVVQVTAFGNTLHVAGNDEQALETALASFREDGRYSWSRSEPTLEDVFISLMANSTDNFQ
jgi:ABC-2 type transport system ATP-binding protein